ncbi:hypothetical protein HZC30_03985 [Candidatus Woesearchaeota archaeon]|nr:hypothetical protein [Candidatus Woesearchaeota archaeon]
MNSITIFNNTFINTTTGIEIGGGGAKANWWNIYNNSFSGAGITTGINVYYVYYLNITNNSFTDNFVNYAVTFSIWNQNLNLWNNYFWGNDGVNGASSSTNTSLCVNDIGNFYNGSVDLAEVPAKDCGPTPKARECIVSPGVEPAPLMLT